MAGRWDPSGTRRKVELICLQGNISCVVYLKHVIHCRLPPHGLYKLFCQVLLDSQPFGHYLASNVGVNRNSRVSEPSTNGG